MPVLNRSEDSDVTIEQRCKDSEAQPQLLTPRGGEFLGTRSESEMDYGGSWFSWSQAEWEVLPHQDQSTPSLPGHGRDRGFPSGYSGRCCWTALSRGRV